MHLRGCGVSFLVADSNFTHLLVQCRAVPSAALVMVNRMASTKNTIAMIIQVAFVVSLSASGCCEVDEEGVCIVDTFPLDNVRKIYMMEYTKHIATIFDDFNTYS